MNPAPEEFDALKKLLALKRHEAPPPGYFDRLPGEVRARILAEAGRAPRLNWWQDWMKNFDAKPVLVAAYAAALVGLVVIGVNFVGNGGKPDDSDLATAPLEEAPLATAVASNTNNSSPTSAPPSFLTNPGTLPFPTAPAGFSPDKK